MAFWSSRRNRCCGRVNFALGARLLDVIAFATCLMMFCKSLPISDDRKTSRSDVSLINETMKELEEALSTLKRLYASRLQAEMESTPRQEADDFAMKSPKKRTQVQDEAEIEEADENKEQEEGRADISLQDFINFLLESIKDKNKLELDEEKRREPEMTSSTSPRPTSVTPVLPSSRHNDLSLKDALEFLEELQKKLVSKKVE